MVENQKLSKKVKHYGPPTNKEDRVIHFKKKWKGKSIKTEKGVTYVMIDREFLHPEDLVSHKVKDQYFHSRISKILNKETH